MPTVEYRPLGRTGLNVSVLSFGASSLGGVFHQVDKPSAMRTVSTAIDLGINFIDVSPFYGVTRAETVLGEALAEIPRDAYYLATKVGRYDQEEFDFSAERVTRSVDESLARLQVDHVDLIQCHDIEFGDLDQIVEETVPALREVVTAGKARFIGITGLPLKVFRHVIERTQVDTVLSYCRYSLNDTGLEKLSEFLEERSVGVISASPLSMGLLTERGPPEWHPAPAAIQEAARRAALHCRSKGKDIAELALQFALAEPRIATTLVGTANPENLRRNCEWIERAPDAELLREVRAILAPVQNETWPSGREENNDA
jgi:L-galactose dehydrogenase